MDIEKYAPFNWYECCEDNYWYEDYADEIRKHDMFTIIACASNDNVMTYYTRHDCPYGWSTLEKIGAMCMYVPKAPHPNRD